MQAINTDFTQGLTAIQKVLYYLLLTLLRAMSIWPLRVLYAFSSVLYVLVYKVIGYRRKLVRRNLHDSFPDKSEQELLSIEKRFYRFFCDYIMETVKLTTMSHQEMNRRVHFSGMEHVNTLVNKGQSVILYLGHYCNWEYVTSIGMHVQAERFFGGQVYHILENKVINAVILKVRSGMGTESVSMQMVLRKILEQKKAGIPVVMGFISDQVPLHQATRYWTRFLNHDGTLVITGTEVIARKCDFACVYLDISRPSRGHYHIQVVPICDHAASQPEWHITERYIRLMEQSIQRAPEYWLWTHNRWKRTLTTYRQWLSENNKQ